MCVCFGGGVVVGVGWWYGGVGDNDTVAVCAK